MKPPLRAPRVWLASLLVLCAVAAAHGPSLQNGFVNLDDGDYVLDNRVVKRGVTAAGVSWALTAFHAANWHPLTWLSHMLDVSLFGLQPAGHHLTSLLLHAACGVALLLLLRALTGTLWPAVGATLLFAVHPLQVESVAWVAARKNVLSTLLWFLTFAAYLRYVRRPSRSRLALVAAALALGLAAKPMLVTAPFTLLLLDWWPLGRWRAGRPAGSLLLEKAPLLALAAAAGAATWAAQSLGGAVAPMRLIPVWERLANAAANLAAYPALALWPRELAAHYPHPGASVSFGTAAAGMALAAGTTALAVRLRLRAPYLLWGWAWYLVTLAPVAGIVQVGEQARADRYAYAVLVGPYVALATASAAVAAGRAARGVAVAAAWSVSLAALACAARLQTAVWRDGVTLFSRVVAVSPGSAKGHLNLGVALGSGGRHGEALEQLALAGTIWPEEALVPYNTGLTLERMGRLREAAAAYREAVRLRPAFPEALANLGLLLERLGEREEAVRQLARAVQLDPTRAEAVSNLATVLAGVGRGPEALERQREAARLDPSNPQIRFNLANQLAGAGDAASAVDEYRAALRLDGANASAHNNLGVALMTLGRRSQAREAFAEAVRLDPTHPGARANLRVLSGLGWGREAEHAAPPPPRTAR